MEIILQGYRNSSDRAAYYHIFTDNEASIHHSVSNFVSALLKTMNISAFGVIIEIPNKDPVPVKKRDSAVGIASR
jgi:hypothetical protein